MARTKKQTVTEDTPEQAEINAVVPGSSSEHYAGKVVVVRKAALAPAYQQMLDRRFLAAGGFGCNPSALGNAVFGMYLSDGEECRIERYEIAGVAVNQSHETVV